MQFGIIVLTPVKNDDTSLFHCKCKVEHLTIYILKTHKAPHRTGMDGMVTYLFIQKFPSVLLYVPFIQVCGQTHETHFGQAEVCQLNVAHRGDEEAEREKQSQAAAQTLT